MPQRGRYDALVPNRTIYVSEDDQSLYQRAQELAGGNLSSAISAALKRYVELEDARAAGFDDITVKVGSAPAARSASPASSSANGSTPRASASSTTASSAGRSGSRSTSIARRYFEMRDAEGNPLTGWRAWTGIGMASGGGKPAEATLDVFDTLEELKRARSSRALRDGLRLRQAAGSGRPGHLTSSASRRCSDDCSLPRHPGLRPPQVVRRAARPGRHRPRGPRRDGVRAARPERRRQDHDDPHPHHPAHTGRRRGRRGRPRPADRSGGHPIADRRDRPVLGGRRPADRRGEPPAHGRPPPPGQATRAGGGSPTCSSASS